VNPPLADQAEGTGIDGFIAMGVDQEQASG
jgi:hypothetical protein